MARLGLRSLDDRKLEHLIVSYAIGGATFVFVVGLWAAIFFDGEWVTHNKWRNKQYGTRRLLNSIAIVVICFTLFSFLAIAAAVVINVVFPQLKKPEFFLWITGFIFFTVALFAEAAGLVYTRYGDAVIPTLNDYEKNSDFDSYIKKYGRDSEWHEWTGINNPSPWSATFVGWLLAHDPPVDLADFPLVNIPAFTQTYARVVDNGYEVAHVSGCAFNWSALIDRGTILGKSPCDMTLSDSDALQCIGGWSADSFTSYWCEITRTTSRTTPFAPSMREIGRQLSTGTRWPHAGSVR
jgi:hypothetical protein